MSTCYYPENSMNSQPQGPNGAAPNPWAFAHHGPSLPVKLLAVGVAFLVFKPLGVALGLYFLFKSRCHGAMGPNFGKWRSRAHSNGNSALDERRRETLNRLQEEEKAFAEFAEKQRQARDKEAFDRFMAERGNGGQTPQA